MTVSTMLLTKKMFLISTKLWIMMFNSWRKWCCEGDFFAKYISWWFTSSHQLLDCTPVQPVTPFVSYNRNYISNILKVKRQPIPVVFHEIYFAKKSPSQHHFLQLLNIIIQSFVEIRNIFLVNSIVETVLCDSQDILIHFWNRFHDQSLEDDWGLLKNSLWIEMSAFTLTMS